MAGLRVVLDTNVLVSGLAYPGSIPGRIVATWRQGGLDVVLSRYILDELVRVLPRLPRIQLTTAEIRDLADSLMFLADMVEPQGEPDNPSSTVSAGFSRFLTSPFIGPQGFQALKTPIFKKLL